MKNIIIFKSEHVVQFYLTILITRKIG